MAQHADPNAGLEQAPSNYTVGRSPQFSGGSIDPTTGNLIAPSNASIANGSPAAPAPSAPAPLAPAPALPTTQLGQISADSPKPPSLSALGASLGKATANAAAPYVGSTIGGSIGSQVGGGASFGSAALNTTRNIGDVLSSGYSPTAATDSFINGAASFGNAGAIGSGIGAGLVTAGIGALTGQKPKEYLPRAAESGGGAYVGSIAGGALGSIFGPGGTLAGSAIGGAIGSYAGPVIANAVSPAISSAERAVGKFLSHIF